MAVMSYTDMPGPFIVSAKVTADLKSIRVSWEWLCRGLPMYINNVRVDYQPEGGSLMMHTVDNTTATGATLPNCNLQCNTNYTIRVHAIGRVNDTNSDPAKVFFYQQEVCTCYIVVHQFTVVCNTVLLQPLPLPLKSLLMS